MGKFNTTEEALGKIMKLGKILRFEAARLHSMSKQEMAAVREAIRINSMNRDKLKEELKKPHHKKHKHHL